MEHGGLRALAQMELPELEEVVLSRVFDDTGVGSAELLAAVAKSRKLRKLDLYGCHKLEPAGLRALAQAEWPELEEVDLVCVFYESGEGSTELLMMLARCRWLLIG